MSINAVSLVQPICTHAFLLQVLINLWSVLRHPKLWPDPDVFRPERFLNEDGKALHRSELIPARFLWVSTAVRGLGTHV